MLFPSAIISQRLTACFKAVEVILIPILLVSVFAQKQNEISKKLKGQVPAIIGVLCVLMSAEMVKNVNAEMNQSRYWGNSVLDYPYVSVFNKSSLSSERILIGDTVREPERISNKKDEAILDII